MKHFNNIFDSIYNDFCYIFFPQLNVCGQDISANVYFCVGSNDNTNFPSQSENDDRKIESANTSTGKSGNTFNDESTKSEHFLNEEAINESKRYLRDLHEEYLQSLETKTLWIKAKQLREVLGVDGNNPFIKELKKRDLKSCFESCTQLEGLENAKAKVNGELNQSRFDFHYVREGAEKEAVIRGYPTGAVHPTNYNEDEFSDAGSEPSLNTVTKKSYKEACDVSEGLKDKKQLKNLDSESGLINTDFASQSSGSNAPRNVDNSSTSNPTATFTATSSSSVISTKESDKPGKLKFSEASDATSAPPAALAGAPESTPASDTESAPASTPVRGEKGFLTPPTEFTSDLSACDPMDFIDPDV